MRATLQDFTVDIQGCNRQFDWLEISLVYDKIDKHLTLYDGYNDEFTAPMIKSDDLANILENYNLTDKKRYHSSSSTQEHLLYKELAAQHLNGYSLAALTDYIINPIYIDLNAAYKCTNKIEKSRRSDSKITIIIETKSALSKKTRLRLWGYGKW